MWEWILCLCDHGGRKIKSEQVEFIDMSPLNKDYRFSVLAQEIRKG